MQQEREIIENILFKTGKFFEGECTEIADIILDDIRQIEGKEGNKEREEIERRNRLLENNLKLGMRLNRPGISEQEQEETWQDYKRRNNL